MDRQDILALLEQAGIAYEFVEHTPVYTIDDLMAMQLPHPETIAKNLFVRDDKKRNYYLITAREDKRVDLKAFALRHGTRKLSFASEAELSALLQLTRGAVTPFGLLHDTAKDVQFYLDLDLAGGALGVHPNDNAATVWLQADDLCRLLRGLGRQVELAEL